VAEKCDTNY